MRSCAGAHSPPVCYCHAEYGPGFASSSFPTLFLIRNPDFTGNLIFKMLATNSKIFMNYGRNEKYLLVRYSYHLIISDFDNWL